MQTTDWNLAALVVGALSALAGVPFAAICLYLRAIRDGQRNLQAALTERVSQLEADRRRIEETIDSVEINYTPREEWLRETMLARSQLERLTELIAGLRAELESSRALATQFHRATNAIVAFTEQLCQRLTQHLPDSNVARASGPLHEPGAG
jgi:hypothetical protein